MGINAFEWLFQQLPDRQNSLTTLENEVHAHVYFHEPCHELQLVVIVSEIDHIWSELEVSLPVWRISNSWLTLHNWWDHKTPQLGNLLHQLYHNLLRCLNMICCQFFFFLFSLGSFQCCLKVYSISRSSGRSPWSWNLA